MKRKIAVALSALMLTGAACIPVCAQPQPADIDITVNGEPLQMLYGPVVENGRTLVPFRDVLEAMGAQVDWDNATKTVTCTLGGKQVSLTIGSDVMKVKGGEDVKLDAVAQIIDTKTYVPVRAISEGLGATVNWLEDTDTVAIETPAAEDAKASYAEGADYSMTTAENSINSGSTVVMPIKTIYPKFKGNGRSVAKLNNYIAQNAMERANSYKMANNKRLYRAYQDAIKTGTRSKFANYSYELKYEVKSNENGIISLYATETINDDIVSKSNVFGVTLSLKSGEVVSADSLLENAVEQAKNAFKEKGFSDYSVGILNLDDNSFYVEDGYLVFVVNAGTLSDKIEECDFLLPVAEEEDDISSATVGATKAQLSDEVLYQDKSVAMKLKCEYPVFEGSNKSLDSLNALIAKTQSDAMSSFKENRRADALAAYKKFEETKSKKNKFMEPWLWTVDCDVKYNNNEIASVVVSTYVYEGDGKEATTYSAYMCDLKKGTLVKVDDYIKDKAKTDAAAIKAFENLIQSDRLNYYTDVYERFDINRASKYISKDGVTYMFSPGELASVSKGVVSVTVPLS